MLNYNIFFFLAEGRREFSNESSYESHNANGIVTLKIVKKVMDAQNPVKIISKVRIGHMSYIRV